MGNALNWWYRLSLPVNRRVVTPQERERERYARLTAGLLFVLLSMLLPLAPIMIFFSPASPSSPPIGIAMLCLLALAWFCGFMGRQRLSAILILAYIFLSVTGPLLTNRLDSSLTPLLNTFSIAVILAGALLPPVAALITGALSCLDISLIAYLALQSGHYNAGGQLKLTTVNLFTLIVALPVAIQVVTAVVVYVIMRNLLTTLHRAERAEEIVTLQNEIAEHEQIRLAEKEQLESGFRSIAEAHARIANGDYSARVSLREDHVLWSVAGPLNTLLHRLQRWRNDAYQLEQTRLAATHIAEQLHLFLQTKQVRPLPITNTPIDPIVIEINRTLFVNGRIAGQTGNAVRSTQQQL